jgi:hypothetical protein
MKVTLNVKERDLLISFLPINLAKLIESAVRLGSAFKIDLPAEVADEIRDACGEQLQRVGFDERYEPTEAGNIWETLVDKFFAG